MDGLRKCLAEEFSNVYVLNLRGDIRKNMLSKGRAKEGQNIFGSGSMSGIAITLFVKNPKNKGKIFYHDIGDDLKREEKLKIIDAYNGISGITDLNKWVAITPDHHGDWLNKRDDRFGKYILLGEKSGKEPVTLFVKYSSGVKTQRDSWCYNASKNSVSTNMKRMIYFYNNEAARFSKEFLKLDKKSKEDKIDTFVDTDPTKINWTRALKRQLVKDQHFDFDSECLTPSLYRPFTRQWLYFNKHFNEEVLQMPRFFPNVALDNLVICVSGVGARSGFSVLISSTVTDLQIVDNGQCFPLYLYEGVAENDQIDFDGNGQDDMFGKNISKSKQKKSSYVRKDGISDVGVKHFQAAYPKEKICKEDVFYYVYGLLHSQDYHERYADNLSKELPRIPCVKIAKDFWHFSKAGRDLAVLHLNYETVKPYPVKLDTGKQKLKDLDDKDYYVEKMKYAKKGDLTTVVYNSHITIKEIPVEAYEYVVNGKPALDWVMERQSVTTHKDSGIVNDANDWAIETIGNAKYPLELFQRVITVSLETMKIVNGLPKLDI